MRNFIENGDTMEYTVPSGATVKSGELVVVGTMTGVAVCDGAEGDKITLNVKGVYQLPKATGAIAQGAKVYWVSADKNVSTTASGNTLIGYAWESALSADTVANVSIER